jgi:DNA (cytosine-5)-methyltransferase 1
VGVWFTCNALSAGLPHNRERIFLVGSYKSSLSHQFYSDCGELLRDSSPREEGRKKARSDLHEEFVSDSPLLVQRRGGFGYTKATSYCPTIRAQTGKHQGGHSDRPILCGQKLDLERMRETDGFSGRLDGRRGRLIGNAVVPPIAEFIGRRILDIQRKLHGGARSFSREQKRNHGGHPVKEHQARADRSSTRSRYGIPLPSPPI